MSELDRDLQAFREATEPDAARLSRLRVDRRRSGASGARWILAVPIALALVWVVWLRWPAAAPEAAPAEVAAVPIAATWTGASGAAALGPYVRAVVDGRGSVSGSALDLTVAWASGTIGLEVEPDRGVALSVETPEGVIRVRGTAFEVRRDPLGTAVSVERGSVEVDCAGQPTRQLGAGEDAICLPTTAVGWLRRVTALQQAGALPEVLTGVDQALALDPAAEVALELRLHQATALAGVDRIDEASEILDALAVARPDAADRIGATRSRILED